MRFPTEFSALEWLRGVPVKDALKQLRNDAWLAIYRRRRAPGLEQFLAQQASLAGGNIVLVIAFEQPWVLQWLLRMSKRNLGDATVLVFDNSRSVAKRAEIRSVCDANDIPYLALPANSTRHVNRSHGMAMDWVYRNVVRRIRPRIFGFIDHDLIPVRKVTIADKLGHQTLYGLVNEGKFGFWSLWAGYCFFDYSSCRDKPLNFLYDFSRDLDTGGRNWRALYRPLSRKSARFASFEYKEMRIPGISAAGKAQFIDQNWLHLGGMGYGGGTPERLTFFKSLENLFDN